MALTCKKHNLLFLMNGGTGCSSIGKVLIERFEGEMLPKKNIYQDGKMVLGRKHNDVRQLLKWEFLNQDDLEKLYIFTTIRNPYDVVASAYARVVSEWEGGMPRDAHGYMIEDAATRAIIRKNAEDAKQMGFDQWVRLRYGRLSQCKQFVSSKIRQKKPVDFLWKANFVMKFENLENDLNTVLSKNGIHEVVRITNINPTRNKKMYHEYYSEDSRIIVQRSFKRIIDRFDYTF